MRTAHFVVALISISALFATTTTLAQSRPDAIELPKPTGPNGVGVIAIHWTQSDRAEPLTSDPDDHRQVSAQVWYPAKASENQTARYAPDLVDAAADHTDDENARVRDVTRLIVAQRDVKTWAVADASVIDQPARFPLVMISPGANVSRHWHSALAQELASQGFVVAVVSHFESGLEAVPGRGIVDSHSRWRDLTDDLDNELSDMLAADVNFALDQLLALRANDAGGQLAERIDGDRVAIIGHSRGGKTVSRACSTDARFDVAVILDNIAPAAERESGLTQPQLSIRTDEPRRWNDENRQALEQFISRNQTAGYQLVIDGADHFSFTDLAFVTPQRVNSKLSADRFHQILCEVILAFLAQHLLGGDAQQLEAAVAKVDEAHLTVSAPAASRPAP